MGERKKVLFFTNNIVQRSLSFNCIIRVYTKEKLFKNKVCKVVVTEKILLSEHNNETSIFNFLKRRKLVSQLKLFTFETIEIDIFRLSRQQANIIYRYFVVKITINNVSLLPGFLMKNANFPQCIFMTSFVKVSA